MVEALRELRPKNASSDGVGCYVSGGKLFEDFEARELGLSRLCHANVGRNPTGRRLRVSVCPRLRRGAKSRCGDVELDGSVGGSGGKRYGTARQDGP